MNKRLPVLMVWLALAPWLAAQAIKIEVLSEQDQFLPGEPMIMNVRISNQSGRPLRFGVDSYWLDFNVVDRQRLPVTRIAPLIAPGEITIQNGDNSTRTIDISPFYDLTKPGSYNITATVQVRDLDITVDNTTAPKKVEIIRGTKVWEQEFGFVPRGAEGAPPETRKYTLLRSPDPKKRQLFLRVGDPAEQRIFKLAGLGQTFTFNIPETQLDRMSFAHVLHQTGQRSFTHSVVSPDGELVMRLVYDFVGSRPTLKGDTEGRVAVSGGVRRPTTKDIPPSSTSSPATTPERVPVTVP